MGLMNPMGWYESAHNGAPTPEATAPPAVADADLSRAVAEETPDVLGKDPYQPPMTDSPPPIDIDEWVWERLHVIDEQQTEKDPICRQEPRRR